MTEKQLRDSRKHAHKKAVHARKRVRFWKRIAHKAHALVGKRTKQIRALPKGEKAALGWALAQVGTTESPAGSNAGPKVSAWQSAFGISASPWCGAFVGNALRAAGVRVTNRIVYVPYIKADAQAGVNGMLKRVPLAQAKAGDLVLFDWEQNGVADHVGMVRKDYTGSGTLLTVEGNTSFDNNGSQSNGGCVALRSRPVFGGMTIVRPKYP